MIIELCEGAYADDRYTSQEVREVMKIIAPALKKITPLFKLVGSNRRGNQADYGDIDLIVTQTSLDNVKKVIESVLDIVSTPRQGSKIMSLVIEYKDKELQLEISLVDKDTFGAASIGMTGSNEFNIALRSIAKKKGFLLNNYGLFDRDSNKLIAGKTESDVFKALGIKFIPPAKRGVTVSQAWDLIREYSLDESVNEYLMYGVVALANHRQIRQDLSHAKDVVSGSLDKLKRAPKAAKNAARATKLKYTKAKRTAKRAGKAIKKTASSVMKKLKRTRESVDVVRVSYNGIRNNPEISRSRRNRAKNESLAETVNIKLNELLG